MKNKKTLMVLSLAFMVLSACNGGGGSSGEGSSSGASSEESKTSATSVDPSATITLFNGNSRLIGTPKADPLNPSQSLPPAEANVQTGKLPTYHHKDKGDVPYVALSDLGKALGSALPNVLTPGMTGEKKSDGYHFYSYDKVGEFIIDAEKDVIKLKNGQAFVQPTLGINNNIPGDYCHYRGNSIQGSEKTKVYKDDGGEVAAYDTFDFSKYHFDIVEQGDNCYVPLEAFTKVLFRDMSLDLAYNGADFYTNVSESSFLASWVYSSQGIFQGLSGIYQPSKTKGQNESYRFEFPIKRASEENPDVMEDYTRFLVLQDGGSAYCMLCKGNELNPSQAVSDTETGYGYFWKKEGDVLHVDVSEQDQPIGTYLIHLDKTRFLSGAMPKEVSGYNYDVLRFMFDTIYGLKDIKKYTDATAFFKSAGVDEGLKSTDPAVYSESFAKLIGFIDDGHTGFNNLTPFISFNDMDKVTDYIKISRSGERLKKLTEASQKYTKAKMDKTKQLDPEGVNPEDPNYYQGIKFSSDKETAIITFNGFGHNGEQIKNMGELFPAGYTIEESDYNIFTRAKLINSTPDGFSQAFKILDIINAKEKIVKNVVVDLTTNGGGEIATMPYLMAFFSDDPIYAIKDVHNGVTREYHYKVDLNGDGKFGDAGDTYKGKFNFYFLTSSFSFSCGNCLPGMAKDAGAKIIGETSGGGTSPVGVYFDALGTFFNLSNHYDMCYKIDGKYTQNDAGITLDHAFPYNEGNWYDPNAINTFLKTL